MTYISQEPKMRTMRFCVVCGKTANSIDHVLFPQRQKPKAMKDWLNKTYNLQFACMKHNIDHRANTYEARERHVGRVMMREGAVGMALWLSECPSEKYKLRDDFQEVCVMVERYGKETK